MRYIFQKINNFSSILAMIILASLFSSCAVAGNMIPPNTWVGVLDLVAAAGITVFILRGANK